MFLTTAGQIWRNTSCTFFAIKKEKCAEILKLLLLPRTKKGNNVLIIKMEQEESRAIANCACSISTHFSLQYLVHFQR